MKPRSRKDINTFRIFVLIDDGKTQQEIAEILGISKQAINKRFKLYVKEGLIKESKIQTKDLRYLTKGNDKIYVVTPKGRELVFMGFYREYIDDLQNAIDAMRYYLDFLESRMNMGEKE